jgi:hypothetical protein
LSRLTCGFQESFFSVCDGCPASSLGGGRAPETWVERSVWLVCACIQVGVLVCLLCAVIRPSDPMAGIAAAAVPQAGGSKVEDAFGSEVQQLFTLFIEKYLALPLCCDPILDPSHFLCPRSLASRPTRHQRQRTVAPTRRRVSSTPTSSRCQLTSASSPSFFMRRNLLIPHSLVLCFADPPLAPFGRPHFGG